MKKIIVVFKTHFDIGFTDLAKEVIERYGSVMLPDVVKTCNRTRNLDKNHRFIWTMSAWPLLKSLTSDAVDPHILKEAEVLINSGQIAWHVLPFTTHTEFCGIEDFIRGLYISRGLSKRYDRWPVTAKMTDVPGHTWILPSLLSKAGIKFLHLGCNAGSTPPDVPRLFFWEGPDDSRVLTFYTKGQYGSSLIPPPDWPFPVWLALMQTSDNAGPQKPEFMQEILDEVQQELPDASVSSGTLDDFYHALSKFPLDSVPVIRGDLADSWIHGVGTYPNEVSMVRALRNQLTEAEKAFSLLTSLIGTGNSLIEKVHSDLAFGYENLLLFGEHTWGLDVKTTLGHERHYKKEAFKRDKSSPSHIRMEESWNEQRDRVTKAESVIRPATLEIMNTLTSGIAVDGPRMAIFNGLGWKRDSLVNITCFGPDLAGKALWDPEFNEFSKLIHKENALYLLVRDLPPLGYKTLVIKDAVAPEESTSSVVMDCKNGTIENKWFKIQADKCTGSISSLKDKRSGREWVDMKNGFGFGAYRYDIYGDEEISEFIRDYAYRFYDWFVNDFGRMEYPSHPHLTFTPPSFDIIGERADGCCSIILKTIIEDMSVKKYGNAKGIEARITLYDDLPFIDLDFRLSAKEETPMVESGYFSFPFNSSAPTFRINKVGSIVDPSQDIVRDCNHVNYCCEHYLEIDDGSEGIAIIPLDTPLFSIGEPGMYKFRHDYKQGEPIVFFNAFNNSWGTNFPQWMGGDFRYSFRVIPGTGKSAPKVAFESVFPALAGYSTGSSGESGLSPVYTLISNDIEGMEACCLKLPEEDQGFILRLREIEGIERELHILLNACIKQIFACDLLEKYDSELTIAPDGGITLQTKPFEIHTLRLVPYHA